MTDPRRERVTIDGHGVIELFGDSDASALHLDFAPVVYEGWDMRGSAGRFAVRLPGHWQGRPGFDTWMTPAELERVRRWLAAPPRGSRPAEALEPLLALLAPGEYDVEFAQLPPIDNGGIGYAFMGGYHYPHTDTPHPHKRPVTRVLVYSKGSAGWYDWDTATTLLPTDTWPPRDTETIDRYREAIRAGRRPAVVVLRTGGTGYGIGHVLDGHHKLAAYLKEDILPWTVDIEALSCRPIGESEANVHRPR